MEGSGRGLDKPTIDAEIEVLVEAQPLSHALQCARVLLQSILDANAPVKDFKGYVTDSKSNFRIALATIQPYKGQRAELMGPIWRRDVEKYLVDEWGAERCVGYEADDKLAIEFTKDPHNSVLCSLDKDFLQLPHLNMYNWTKKEHTHVTPIEAHRNFYKQMLVGDTIDNIVGCKGVGPKGADKLLDNLKDEKLMMIAVYGQYLKAYGKNAWAYLCENAKLLWLLRSESDLQNPSKAWKPCIIPQGAL